MTYYVYMLRCKDGSLYSGITTNPERRLKQHVTGVASKYTKTHGAVCFARVWATETGRGGASKLEYALKQLSKQEKEFLAGGGTLASVLPESAADFSDYPCN